MNATVILSDARARLRAVIVLFVAVLLGLAASSCLEPEDTGEEEVIASEDPCWPDGCEAQSDDEEAPAGAVCDSQLVVREQVTFKSGGDTLAVDPLQGAGSVVDFYSYGSPDKWSANTGFEMSQRLTLIPYRSPDEQVSLVFIFDAAGDADGGHATMNASGGIKDMEIAVFDDPNSKQDSYDLKTGKFAWNWGPCCTDGMAITLSDSYKSNGKGDCVIFNVQEMSGIDGIDVVDPRGDRNDLGDVSQPIKICVEPTTCCPTAEVCDGVDNDCDGEIDEGLDAEPTTCGVGACERNGWLFCAEGLMYDTCVAGEPAADDTTCDGVDDDCDGEADEDHLVTATSCTSDDGQCSSSGELLCVSGAAIDTCSVTNKAPELCDGLDNDCDGEVDEGAADACADAPGCAYGNCECIAGACVLE